MTILLLKRLSLIIAVGVIPWASVGCGGGDVATTMPTDTPPIPTDGKGKPLPPPTAAAPTSARK